VDVRGGLVSARRSIRLGLNCFEPELHPENGHIRLMIEPRIQEEEQFISYSPSLFVELECQTEESLCAA